LNDYSNVIINSDYCSVMNKLLIILTALLSIISLGSRADNESIEQLEHPLACATDTAGISMQESESSKDSLIFYYFMEKAKASSSDSIQRAHQYADSAFMDATKYDNWLNAGLAEEYRGNLFKSTGEFDSARYHFHQALISFEKGNYYSQAAWVKRSLGVIETVIGNFQEAMNLYVEGSDLAEKGNDDKALAFCYKGIAFIYHRLLQFDKSFEIGQKSYQLILTTDFDSLELAQILLTYAVTLSYVDQVDSALACNDLAAKIFQQYGDINKVSEILNNTAIIYENQGLNANALANYNRCTQIYEGNGNFLGLTFSHVGQSNIYLKIGNLDSALYHSKKGFEIAESLNAPQRIYSIGETLSTIYKELGKYDSALYYLEITTVVKDSIYRQDIIAQTRDLQTKYETEKKEQEIENLKAINEKVRYRNISFAGAAISFLILAVLLYYIQNLRVRRNRLLLEKEKELDQMKSRFFANISHEFRTPLTLIIGPLDDLISSTDLPDSRKKLTVMQRNADRLLDLVNQLLDLSRIESGKLKLNISRTDIIPVIKGVAMSFHSIAEQKDIRLDMDVHPNTLEMNYDRSKFETILTNLLSNAFKFTEVHGKISVFSTIVKGPGKSSGSEFLSIVVADNGQGIPAAEVDFIFDRFYQSDTNQLLQHEGSGIGLALTKELVELHKGSIRAESKMGEGTTITIELPIDMPLQDGQLTISKESVVEKALQIHEAVEQLDEDDTSLSGNRPVILVIEDHEDVRHYIQEILSKDYAIVSAMDGEEGISKALETIPDLIISDVMMPKKDGYEVCSILKNDERTSHIPLILLTAKSDSEDKITGLSTKADDYVTKPFVPRELLLRIENLIESRKKLREKYSKGGVIRPKEMEVTSIDEKFLNKLIDKVEGHLSDEKFGVEQLGDELGMSRSQLHRKLTALLGQGPNQFIRTFRLQRAHDLLRQKAATASEISYRVGFGSPSYFTKCFHDQFGYTPTEVLADG